jgi:hypothetical protein
MAPAQQLFERLVDELGYTESGGLLYVDERPESGAREMALARVKRHLPGITAVYFAGDVPLIYFSTHARIDRSTIATLHKRVWNDSRVPLLFVIDPGQILVYDAWAEPTDDPEQIDDGKRLIRRLTALDDLLKNLEQFRRSHLDTGAYANELAHRFDVSSRCDFTLLRNLEITRERLIEDGLSDDAVHNLLIRSILLLHLEHREILKPSFYESFQRGAKKLTDLYPNRDLTYEAFARLAEQFNGDLLPVEPCEAAVDRKHLLLLRDFLEGGVDVKTRQRMLWPLYDFSIIPIQLISSVYERLLHAINPKAAKETGAYYTPFPLAELMVNEVLPWPSRGQGSSKLVARIIDPSCGSGVFLVEAFRRLAAYARADGKVLDSGVLSELLHSCIYGIDENRLAVRVAAFSLCLALLDEIDAQPIDWDALRFPRLTSAPEGNRPNLITGDAFTHAPGLGVSFDLVVGNPPWKRGKLPGHVRAWLKAKEYPAAEQIAHAFMWLARDLAPEGRGAMLSPSKWLFNREGPDIEFRRAFFRRNQVETVINLSALLDGENRLFKAHAPATGLIFRSNRTAPSSPSILYCTPRPGYAAAVPTALLIDGGDLKWLPREEAEQDDLVWKAMYAGSWRDLRLVRRLSEASETLDAFIKARPGWISSRGFQPSGNKSSPEILSKPFVASGEIDRYVSPFDASSAPWPRDGFKWTGDVLVYKGPHVLIKEGTNGGQLWAAFTPEDCTFRDAITGVHAPRQDEPFLKALVAYLNSSLAAYYLFMTSGWGIDRPRVKKGEVLSLPATPLKDRSVVSTLSALFDEIDNSTGSQQRKAVESRIETVVFKVFDLTQSERILVRDMAATGIDYAQKTVRSKSIQPPSKKTLDAYVEGYLSVFGRMLASGGRGLAATIHGSSSPLRVVSFRIADSQADWGRVDYKGDGEIGEVLKSLDGRLMQREGVNLYRRRHVRIFEDQAVHIIKPAETRFWTQSAGFHDADETIAQTVAGMANVVSRPGTVNARSR